MARPAAAERAARRAQEGAGGAGGGRHWIVDAFLAGVEALDPNQVWFLKLSGALLAVFLAAVYTPAVVLRAVFALVVCGYFVPHIAASFAPVQNLALRYSKTGPPADKKWAFVSGASSGIGLAIAKALARDGISVIVAAYPDKLLDESVASLEKEFGPSGVHFRKCPVDLGDSTAKYMDAVATAAQDIDVQLVYNNAGFIVTGFFHKTPLAKWMANLECNANAQVRITHFFVERMVAKELTGAVVFTSSAAGCMPSPFASIYGSSKSFLSAFASAIATELKPKGIDVCVVHPSPVASRFYDAADKIDLMEFFKRFSVEADELPHEFSKAIGRAVWKDVGAVAIIFRMVSKLVDANAMGLLMGLLGRHLPDYKRYA